MKPGVYLSELANKKSSLPFLLAFGALTFTGCGENKNQSAEDQETNDSIEMEENETSAGINELSQQEREDGWELLFDGETTEGWRGYLKDSFPSQGWVIEDGALKVQGSGAGEAGGGGGDIIYDEQFKDFELSLEWKVSEGGNSGIFYLAEEVEGEPIYTSAPEMQILDNERHPDARLGENGNRQAGSLYDLVPADPQNARPVGEWNEVTIIVYRGTVVHMQNGETVVEYHLWTDEWEEMVKNSKFSDWENFLNAGGEDRMGYIGLQDHGDDVWFRNIKIKEL